MRGLVFHRIGELEDETGDGQDDVDEVRFFVAFEVDPAPGHFVRANGGCCQMLLGGGLVGGLLLSCFGRVWIGFPYCRGGGCGGQGWGLGDEGGGGWRAYGGGCGGGWREGWRG